VRPAAPGRSGRSEGGRLGSPERGSPCPLRHGASRDASSSSRGRPSARRQGSSRDCHGPRPDHAARPNGCAGSGPAGDARGASEAYRASAGAARRDDPDAHFRHAGRAHSPTARTFGRSGAQAGPREPGSPCDSDTGGEDAPSAFAGVPGQGSLRHAPCPPPAATRGCHEGSDTDGGLPRCGSQREGHEGSPASTHRVAGPQPGHRPAPGPSRSPRATPGCSPDERPRRHTAETIHPAPDVGA
jgi:hypothetical protein